MSTPNSGRRLAAMAAAPSHGPMMQARSFAHILRSHDDVISSYEPEIAATSAPP
jgi:hypothetical protein|tara:strand:- start:242 stop:403 length:162 start_codon:yes stop_codon:yes gene_type:complete